MDRIQAKVGHGFVPFVKVLVKACSEEGGKYVHYGVTTQNIQQTGQLYVTYKIHRIFQSYVADILDHLGDLAEAHAETVMPGRTHGRHAIPITYGYKVSVWISELLNAQERLQECEKRVFQAMAGGAVGAFNATGETGWRVQQRFAKKLGMYSMPVPSRNIFSHKEEYIMNLALLCNALHKIAEEVYYTGLEEFGEVSEAFQKGTVGSSTMPQKINPKLKIEGILLTMTDSRTNYGKQIDTLIRQAYGSKIKVFDQTIPRSVRAAETSAAGKSIFHYDPKSKVAEAYQSLAKTNY